MLRGYLDVLIVAGLAALFLTTFVVRTFYIPSDSMFPTLRERDVLLVNEVAYHLHTPWRGDVAVFTPPIVSPTSFIKRVVAVPGDTLKIRNGRVYVNGSLLREPYVTGPPSYSLSIRNYGIYVDDGSGEQPLDHTQANIPPRSMWQAPNRIPKGFYFVMGDNRNDSEDSHVWGFAQLRGHFVSGPLAKSNVTADFSGRAILVLWPLNRLRVLE